MADVKISAETTASALTGVELLPLVQSNANRKTTARSIAYLARLTDAIVTGAAPTNYTPDFNVTETVLQVTSGGTGAEILNIVNPPVDGVNGDAYELAGYAINIIYRTQGAGGDAVQIKAGGATSIAFLAKYLRGQSLQNSSVLLNYIASTVRLVWDGWQYNIDWLCSEQDFSYDPADLTFSTALLGANPSVAPAGISPGTAVLQAVAATSGFNGGQVSVVGGACADSAHNGGGIYITPGAHSSTGAGGEIVLTGGTSSGGAGGNVQITAGSGATAGHIILANLPTANPNIVGALYTAAGVLKVSAG